MVRRTRHVRLLLVSGLVLAPWAVAAEAARPPERTTSRIETLGRLLELEDRRSAGNGELERLLRHPDAGIRRRAALAAGRVALPALAPPLALVMNDQDVEVRRMAAFALGLLGDAGARDRLVAALGDSDARVRGRAAEALGRVGDARAAAEIARLIVGALPRTIGRMTVRGDDPSDPTDSWAELRLALFALARVPQEPSHVDSASQAHRAIDPHHRRRGGAVAPRLRVR